MYLSKLEIQGFKSFAQKTILEFNKDLTAIVGPNGSGKSNIADAVRWVLGEQSLKVLRGKKSEDVIFAGSDQKSRLGFAEVSLHLNNQDGTAPLDYQEIVITRRIYRDGSGEYLINKNKVRLTDIQLLMAKASFGQRSYSIIGQGMVDSILTSSSQERKEFFDEATGVRQYQIKKDQSILKLDRSQENLAQSDQLIQEIEPRLKSLSRQVKKLERKTELEAELNAWQTRYYSYLAGRLNGDYDKIQSDLRSTETVKLNLEQEIADKQAKLDSQQLQSTEAASWQKLQQDYQSLTGERNRLSQELAIVRGQVDLDLTKAGKVDLVWLNNKQSEIKDQLAAAQQKLADKKEAVDKLSSLLQDKQLEQQSVIDEFNQLQQELIQAQQQSAKAETVSLIKLKKQLTELLGKQDSFLRFLEGVNDLEDLQKIKDKALALSEEIKELVQLLDQVDQTEDQSDLSHLQHKLNDFLTSKDVLVNEVQDLKIKQEIARQQLEQLAEVKDRLSGEADKLAQDLKTYSGQLTSAELKDQQTGLEKQIEDLDKRLEDLKQDLEKFSEAQAEEKAKFIGLQKDLRDLQIKLNVQNNQVNEIRIELAKIETNKENLDREILTELGDSFQNQNIKELNKTEAETEIARLKNQLAVIGGIDREVVAEYQEVSERYDFLTEQSTDLKLAIQSCQEIIEELDNKIAQQFEKAFERINEKFQHYFKILFGGGKSQLILQKIEIKPKETEIKEADQATAEAETTAKPVRKNKQYEYGIEIQATPPGKKLQSLNMLSGGEKALTSIALISAIMANNPSPFVILDEVDAALDEANSVRFAQIVEELSAKTQFVCITHNRATMEQAAILYGVTMGSDGISKLLSINLSEAEKVAEAS